MAAKRNRAAYQHQYYLQKKAAAHAKLYGRSGSPTAVLACLMAAAEPTVATDPPGAATKPAAASGGEGAAAQPTALAGLAPKYATTKKKRNRSTYARAYYLRRKQSAALAEVLSKLCL